MSPDLKNWYEAANPMMLSMNNSLESHNNVFKRDYSGRKRLSMPHLVDKLKEMVEVWSKTPKEKVARVSTVLPAIKKSAEELLKKLDDYVLFRLGKDYDRPTVKPRGNVVSGELKQVGICPRQGYIVTTREKFNEDAKKIVKRRQNIDYSNFNEFRNDLHQIALMEVIELEDGNI